eukprot:CAMPEP_0184864322 /NCGR_PEP_ID=MMETSP0580-20130426/14509_1 /TAXON_ID=1118495 /ORGANISM="Dactyliosolen fragilissimus" /LENGTH=1422 /DNA_ID=CAMNT_0027363049 /DNA_START=71 /DNA_END=4339 /DNA_ORIENTATION=-
MSATLESRRREEHNTDDDSSTMNKLKFSESVDTNNNTSDANSISKSSARKKYSSEDITSRSQGILDKIKSRTKGSTLTRSASNGSATSSATSMNSAKKTTYEGKPPSPQKDDIASRTKDILEKLKSKKGSSCKADSNYLRKDKEIQVKGDTASNCKDYEKTSKGLLNSKSQEESPETSKRSRQNTDLQLHLTPQASKDVVEKEQDSPTSVLQIESHLKSIIASSQLVPTLREEVKGSPLVTPTEDSNEERSSSSSSDTTKPLLSINDKIPDLEIDACIQSSSRSVSESPETPLTISVSCEESIQNDSNVIMEPVECKDENQSNHIEYPREKDAYATSGGEGQRKVSIETGTNQSNVIENENEYNENIEVTEEILVCDDGEEGKYLPKNNDIDSSSDVNDEDKVSVQQNVRDNSATEPKEEEHSSRIEENDGLNGHHDKLEVEDNIGDGLEVSLDHVMNNEDISSKCEDVTHSSSTDTNVEQKEDILQDGLELNLVSVLDGEDSPSGCEVPQTSSRSKIIDSSGPSSGMYVAIESEDNLTCEVDVNLAPCPQNNNKIEGEDNSCGVTGVNNGPPKEQVVPCDGSGSETNQASCEREMKKSEQTVELLNSASTLSSDNPLITDTSPSTKCLNGRNLNESSHSETSEVLSHDRSPSSPESHDSSKKSNNIQSPPSVLRSSNLNESFVKICENNPGFCDTIKTNHLPSKPYKQEKSPKSPRTIESDFETVSDQSNVSSPDMEDPSETNEFIREKILFTQSSIQHSVATTAESSSCALSSTSDDRSSNEKLSYNEDDAARDEANVLEESSEANLEVCETAEKINCNNISVIKNSNSTDQRSKEENAQQEEIEDGKEALLNETPTRHKSESQCQEESSFSPFGHDRQRASMLRDQKLEAVPLPSSIGVSPAFTNKTIRRLLLQGDKSDMDLKDIENDAELQDKELHILVKSETSKDLQPGSSCFELRVPVMQIIRKERYMRHAAREAKMRKSTWFGSLLFCKLREVMMKDNASFEIEIDPEFDTTDADHYTKRLVWSHSLSQCILSYYDKGSINVPEDIGGNRILLAMEYFSLIYSPADMSFESYDCFQRVKLWCEYYNRREDMANFIVRRMAKRHSLRSHLFVTVSEPMSGSFYVQKKRCEIFDGGEVVKGVHSSIPDCHDSGNSFSVVYDFFNDEDDQIKIKDRYACEYAGVGDCEQLRNDFAAYLEYVCPGVTVTFSLQDVTFVGDNSKPSTSEEDHSEVMVTAILSISFKTLISSQISLPTEHTTSVVVQDNAKHNSKKVDSQVSTNDDKSFIADGMSRPHYDDSCSFLSGSDKLESVAYVSMGDPDDVENNPLEKVVFVNMGEHLDEIQKKEDSSAGNQVHTSDKGMLVLEEDDEDGVENMRVQRKRKRRRNKKKLLAPTISFMEFIAEAVTCRMDCYVPKGK